MQMLHLVRLKGKLYHLSNKNLFVKFVKNTETTSSSQSSSQSYLLERVIWGNITCCLVCFLSFLEQLLQATTKQETEINGPFLTLCFYVPDYSKNNNEFVVLVAYVVNNRGCCMQILHMLLQSTEYIYNVRNFPPPCFQ